MLYSSLLSFVVLAFALCPCVSPQTSLLVQYYLLCISTLRVQSLSSTNTIWPIELILILDAGTICEMGRLGTLSVDLENLTCAHFISMGCLHNHVRVLLSTAQRFLVRFNNGTVSSADR